jgi:hypothetical protein
VASVTNFRGRRPARQWGFVGRFVVAPISLLNEFAANFAANVKIVYKSAGYNKFFNIFSNVKGSKVKFSIPAYKALKDDKNGAAIT